MRKRHGLTNILAKLAKKLILISLLIMVIVGLARRSGLTTVLQQLIILPPVFCLLHTLAIGYDPTSEPAYTAAFREILDRCESTKHKWMALLLIALMLTWILTTGYVFKDRVGMVWAAGIWFFSAALDSIKSWVGLRAMACFTLEVIGFE